MLGLLRSPSGHHVNPTKPTGSEPVVTEVAQTPTSERANPIAAHAENSDQLTALLPAVRSPTQSHAGSVRLRKQGSFYGKAIGSVRASFGRFTNHFVKEQHEIIRRRCQHELGASVDHRAFDTSYAGLLEWIRHERLTRLPHKGGSWDRVLIAAQYFAEQVHRFNNAIEDFTIDSGAASHLVYGHCLLLLELGSVNGAALEKVFTLFYQFGLELAPLLKRADIFDTSQPISDNLGRAFADLLSIVTGVAITFYQAVHGGRHHISLDFYASFGSLIENFRLRTARCAHDMWKISLLANNITDCDHIDVLERWLSPKDTILSYLAASHVNLVKRPEQFTCVWFQSNLTSFFKSNEKILLVEGKAGTGKTTLASWVVDRLQRPIARRSVSTLSFFFNPSIVSQATSLDLVKTLLYQLLCQRIGDVRLYEAINKAFLESKSLNSAEKQEEKLWLALSSALHVLNDEDDETIAIIVDGLDEIHGQKVAAQRTAKKLHDLAQKISAVRLIQLSQPLELAPSRATHVTMSMENTYDDLRTVVRQAIVDHVHFKDRDDSDRERIIEQLALTAGGSMLWLSLACHYLTLQTSHSTFDQAVDLVQKSSKTVPDMIQHILAALNLDVQSKSLLSWLVAAERPFSLDELTLLLQVHPEHFTMTDKKVDTSALLKSIRAFTIVEEDLVMLRHNAIKQALISIPSASKVSLNLKERHKELVMRLLVYIKSCLRDNYEPTFAGLDEAIVSRKLQSHRLVEYTVRYWTIHFRKSSLFKVSGNLELPKHFAAIFPSSVELALLEMACWNSQSFAHEALDLHSVAFRVRKTLFGQDYACVLQSAIVCAILCERALSRHAEAIEWYASAAKISKVVIGVQAELTITCCKTLLVISESFVSKQRTTIMTYREEIYLVLVSAYSHRCGAHSKEVLEIYHKLAELYVFISEEHKSTEIYKKIQEITVIIYGSHSAELDIVNKHLPIELVKHKHKHVEVIEGDFLGGYVGEVEESFTLIRIEILIKMAADFVVHGEFERAEEIYIELWLRLTEHCHSHHVLEWHEKKIQIMLIYSQFLRTHKRVTEASALLLCVWREYEHHEFALVESMIILLKEVAVCMKMVGLLSIALSVFRKCWSFFKSTHREETVIFREIEEHITITSTEIVKTTKTTTTTSSSETIIREVFESSMTSTETTISKTTIDLCESLTSIYIHEERWSEAITCIKSVLRKSWSSFFSSSEEITISDSFTSENIELVIKLAHCYILQKRYEKAEFIYMRLYRLYRKSCRLDDKVVLKYSEMLLAFYEKHELFTKAISFYQEILVEYRAFFGVSHLMTIKILYALGDLCRQHHLTHGYWVEYYLEIVTCLNKGSLICHEEALRALIIVAEHHYEALRFSEALVYFKSIFATFCKHGLTYKYFEQNIEVQKLIEHYFRSIEESKIEIHVHIHMVKELREACYKYYGASSSITINTTIVLASTCSRSEKYEFEAISYYEHIMKHSSTVSTEVIKKTQTTLKTLYIKQITSKSESTTVTKETIERATTMVYERYIETRKSYSCTHETTLTQLKELIMLYHRHSKVEFAIKELRSVIVDIIVKITSAKEHVESAKFIAAIFIACGYVEQGFELIRELKLQIIYKSSKTVGCDFDVTRLGRVCFSFIAAFEFYLRANFTLTLAHFMAELVAEASYYERFIHCIKIKSKMELVFLNGARLRHILVRTKRVEIFAIIEHQALEYFMSHEAAVVKVGTKASIAAFVRVLLEYFSTRGQITNFVAAAGHAAVEQIRLLMKQNRHKEALELTTCIFKYLMSHEGLDDPTEITLGFQLCLLMAGRGEGIHKSSDAALQKSMLSMSRQILGEVFDICKANNISLARCRLGELNELITMVGEQKDYPRLQWLLTTLWTSREGQSSWNQSTILSLGKRLVQAEFSSGNRTAAIRLCEDIVYNVRRVHGARHLNTLSFYALLAGLYTSLALNCQAQSAWAGDKDKSHMLDMSKMYFKKAMNVHEDVLKLLVDAENMDNSDDDDDLESEIGASVHHQAGHGQAVGVAPAPFTRAQEIAAIRSHILKLRMAAQRLGGWARPKGDYERLTAKVWDGYGDELKLKEQDVLAKKWKIDGYGQGKAEADVSEDGFTVPPSWEIVVV